MSTAPRDGTLILVCERWDTDGEYHVMAAAYLMPHGKADLEGWWCVGRTSQLLPHVYSEAKQEAVHARGLPIAYRELASHPISWMPLPPPEPDAKCRRRDAAMRRD